jgi:SAM-dependent methyltransferase
MRSRGIAGVLFALVCGVALAAPGHGPDHGPGEGAGHGAEAGHAANEHMNQRPFEELVRNFESEERMAWQRPDALVARLGPLEGRTVADIGSGSGFLAFRMADAGARVLCIDIDERFLAYILGKRDALGLGDRVETRLSPPDRPALEAGEVDLVVTVNTYHHIEDRVAYFRLVREALRPGGRLVVVDFSEGELPVGPGPAMKIPAARIEEELRAAGFNAIEVDRETLPWQFVLTAS